MTSLLIRDAAGIFAGPARSYAGRRAIRARDRRIAAIGGGVSRKGAREGSHLENRHRGIEDVSAVDLLVETGAGMPRCPQSNLPPRSRYRAGRTPARVGLTSRMAGSPLSRRRR